MKYILLFLVLIFAISPTISGDLIVECHDYLCSELSSKKNGLHIRHELRLCLRNDECWDRRENWACVSCSQITASVVTPKICTLIDDNSWCYINECRITACEYIGKGCLAFSILQCAFSCSPCITRNCYDKVLHWIGSKNDIKSLERIPSQPKTKNSNSTPKNYNETFAKRVLPNYSIRHEMHYSSDNGCHSTSQTSYKSGKTNVNFSHHSKDHSSSDSDN